jgi:hypothetical protein
MNNFTSTLVLANAARTVGIVLGVLLLLAFAIAVLFNMRKGRAEVGSEIELAANRKPYLDDDELETKKLDRTLGAGLVILAVIGIAFPLYWLAEPSRQTNAVDEFKDIAIRRGEDIYVNGAQCASCHGPNGVGGVANYTITDPAGLTSTANVTVNLLSDATKVWPSQVFAPYVDTTLWPTFDMVKVAKEQGLRHLLDQFFPLGILSENSLSINLTSNLYRRKISGVRPKLGRHP